MDAVYKYGPTEPTNHTPVGAVAAGDVVIIGVRPHIAHRAIEAGKLGAVSARGGVYEMVKDGTSGPVFNANEEAYWDAGTGEITDVAEDNYHFGYAVADAGANEATVTVKHDPGGVLVDEVS